MLNNAFEEKRRQRAANNQQIPVPQNAPVSTFAAPVRPQIVTMQAPVMQNPAALGISVVEKQPQISMQSQAVLQNQGLAPPPQQNIYGNQPPRQQFQAPAIQNPYNQQPPQQSYQAPPQQQYQQPVQYSQPPPPQQYQQPQAPPPQQYQQQQPTYQQQQPKNRQEEYEKMSQNQSGLSFQSKQPRYEEQAPTELPVNKRDAEINKYQTANSGLQFNSYQRKLQANDVQQVEPNGQEQISPPPKLKPKNMTDAEYDKYSQEKLRNDMKLVIKKAVWDPKVSNFDLRQATEAAKEDPALKKYYDQEKAAKQASDEQSAQKKQQEQQETDQKRAFEKQREADAKRQEKEEQDRRREAEQMKPIKRSPPPALTQDLRRDDLQIAQSVVYERQPDQRYDQPQSQYQSQYPEQQSRYPDQRQMDYRRPVVDEERSVRKLEAEIDDLRYNIKQLREQLRRTELDAQRYEREAADAKHLLEIEKDQRVFAERALVNAQNDMAQYRTEISNFQNGLKTGQVYQPNLPNLPANGYMAKHSPVNQGNITRQEKLMRDLQMPILAGAEQQMNVNQGGNLGNGNGGGSHVENLLQQAQNLISNYQVSEGTMNRAGLGQFAQAQQQVLSKPPTAQSNRPLSNRPPSTNVDSVLPSTRVDSQKGVRMSTGQGQRGAPEATLQADASLLRPESPEKEESRKLVDILNQPSVYDTMEMQKPPENVPLSLLQSWKQDNFELPQAKFSSDADSIIKKYAK